jgi:hypothetical protein
VGGAGKHCHGIRAHWQATLNTTIGRLGRRRRVLATPERDNAGEGLPLGFNAGGAMTKFSDRRPRGILSHPPPHLS